MRKECCSLHDTNWGEDRKKRKCESDTFCLLSSPRTAQTYFFLVSRYTGFPRFPAPQHSFQDFELTAPAASARSAGNPAQHSRTSPLPRGHSVLVVSSCTGRAPVGQQTKSGRTLIPFLIHPTILMMGGRNITPEKRIRPAAFELRGSKRNHFRYCIFPDIVFPSPICHMK
jgi:hypothetical protein